jgi:replicative DNA helicase
MADRIKIDQAEAAAGLDAEAKLAAIVAAADYEVESQRGFISDFDTEIEASKNRRCIPTGFAGLDAVDVLDGGLYDGLYIIGAIPSLGKTSLVLQMADQMAAGGAEVVIFSLEMSRLELMAKSISRLTAQACGFIGDDGITGQDNGAFRNWKSSAKDTRQILSGWQYVDYGQKALNRIAAAKAAYKDYAGRLHVIEGRGGLQIDESGNIKAREATVGKIREAVERNIRIKGAGANPVVIVDYLQIMAPPEALARASDKQIADYNVYELKAISREFRIPVIVISSFNRQNYGAASFEAFKESGGIEYSCDVLIGLQIAGVKKPDAGNGGSQAEKEAAAREEVEKAKAKFKREVEVKILKNRNGLAGQIISFNYYTPFNLFMGK